MEAQPAIFKPENGNDVKMKNELKWKKASCFKNCWCVKQTNTIVCCIYHAQILVKKAKTTGVYV